MVSNSEKYSRFAVMCKIESQKYLDKTGRWFMYCTQGVRYGLEFRTPRNSRIWNLALKRKSCIILDSLGYCILKYFNCHEISNYWKSLTEVKILYAGLFYDRPRDCTCVYLKVHHMLSSKFCNGFALHIVSIQRRLQ